MMQVRLDVRQCRKLPLERRAKTFELIAGQLMREYTIRTGIEVPQDMDLEVVEAFAEGNPTFAKVYEKIMEVREALLGF
ncbi:hypothetical protein V8J36_09215 [Frigidibacter sp. MR17.14]|uniref:hypothetical protein n=1 Tax=Frigidibacter sp. MR17.14 TaxID=3126509 RepID=UPI003012D986